MPKKEVNPSLTAALTARDPATKSNLFNEVRADIKAGLETNPEDDPNRYLLACLDAKGAGLPKPDYKSAGALLVKIGPHFKDDDETFCLHAEDLTRICECDVEAAKFILKRGLFSSRVCPDYLARIAESSAELSSFILADEQLAAQLDAFDIARMGANDLESAKTILKTESLFSRLDPWGIAWIGEAHIDAAKFIFSKENFYTQLDATGIYRLASKFKPISKYVLEKEEFVSKLSPDQVQRLKAMLR